MIYGRRFVFSLVMYGQLLHGMPLHNRDTLTPEVARAVVVYKTVKKYPYVSSEVRTKTIDYWARELFYWKSRTHVLYSEALHCYERVRTNIENMLEATNEGSASHKQVIRAPHIHRDEAFHIILYYVRVLFEGKGSFDQSSQCIPDNDIPEITKLFWEHSVHPNQAVLLGDVATFAHALRKWMQSTEEDIKALRAYSFNEMRDVLCAMCIEEGGNFDRSIGALVSWWIKRAGVANKKGGITTGPVRTSKVEYTPLELRTLCRKWIVTNAKARKRTSTQELDDEGRRKLKKIIAQGSEDQKLHSYVFEKFKESYELQKLSDIELPAPPKDSGVIKVRVRRSVRSRAQNRD